jgi:hypothetical protein
VRPPCVAEIVPWKLPEPTADRPLPKEANPVIDRDEYSVAESAMLRRLLPITGPEALSESPKAPPLPIETEEPRIEKPTLTDEPK